MLLLMFDYQRISGKTVWGFATKYPPLDPQMMDFGMGEIIQKAMGSKDSRMTL